MVKKELAPYVKHGLFNAEDNRNVVFMDKLWNLIVTSKSGHNPELRYSLLDLYEFVWGLRVPLCLQGRRLKAADPSEGSGFEAIQKEARLRNMKETSWKDEMLDKYKMLQQERQKKRKKKNEENREGKRGKSEDEGSSEEAIDEFEHENEEDQHLVSDMDHDVVDPDEDQDDDAEEDVDDQDDDDEDDDEDESEEEY